MKLETLLRTYRRGKYGLPVGFTLVELLVAIAIIGILLGLLLPAIQAAREASRRSSCSNNLKQLAIGIQKYHGDNGSFPPGCYLLNKARDPSISWRVLILNEIEQNALFEQIEPNRNGGAKNWEAQTAAINTFICPSTDAPSEDPLVLKDSNYAGVAGPGRDNKRVVLEAVRCGDVATDGVFYPQSRTRISQITDGTSKTLAIGERTYNFFDWMSGAVWEGSPSPTRICMRATKNIRFPINADLNDPSIGYYVGDNEVPAGATKAMLVNDMLFGSQHSGGAQFCFADGAVQFVEDDIDFKIFEDMCTTAGNEVTE